MSVTEVVSELPLTGRVALVTGASRGIGRACAVALARAGCAVAVNFLEHAEDAEETAAQCERASVKAGAFRADVSDADEVDRMWVEITAALGAPTVLVNNVGERIVKPLSETAPDEWLSVMRTNLDAAFFCSRAVLPAMRASRFGRIVSIAHAPAELAGASPGAGAYAAAKVALLSLTRSLAAEEAKNGITVNAVGPGLVDDEQMPDARREQLEAAAPIGRLAQPEEIARIVTFLASPKSEYITGAHVNVGGGWTL
jgi:3-oxoacyl-[acyl-carrier protein] reductase